MKIVVQVCKSPSDSTSATSLVVLGLGICETDPADPPPTTIMSTSSGIVILNSRSYPDPKLVVTNKLAIYDCRNE